MPERHGGGHLRIALFDQLSVTIFVVNAYLVAPGSK
jgi:hypothetical protein